MSKNATWIWIALIGLSAAFLAVSFAVWFFGARPGLIRHKFKLGSMIIMFNAMLAACHGVTEPTEEMTCYGCASSKDCHYGNVRDCARNKRISNCGKCTFYSCDKIDAVFDQTRLYEEQCKINCNTIDYHCLHQAFFIKKERLDAIHLELNSKTEKK